MLCSLKQNSSQLLQLTCVVTDKQQMVLFSVIKNQLTKQAISFWAKYTKLPRTTVWKIFLISGWIDSINSNFKVASWWLTKSQNWWHANVAIWPMMCVLTPGRAIPKKEFLCIFNRLQQILFISLLNWKGGHGQYVYPILTILKLCSNRVNWYYIPTKTNLSYLPWYKKIYNFFNISEQCQNNAYLTGMIFFFLQVFMTIHWW